ncbi:MAG: PIN domain-containing protein [Thermomicrobiales bacterium]
MKTTFIDSNVVICHLLQNHPDHSPRSSALFARIALGQETGVLGPTVVFETVFTMSRLEKLPRARVRHALIRLLALEHLICAERAILVESLELWVKETPLSFADCYHLLYARHLGLTQIYTFDRKMNRLPGVTRVEP